ncbi:DUF484 family protein [Sphingomonas quercus]|uniref:DUF484 family protein n=1 Tax=Sphingomonas quercus TaxID=2842451 RepID=UPI00209B37C2|nr:DUF484 family protein [Sphingomonas quercus]
MVIDFEKQAVATLRRRVAEVEEANQDLIAFARGHSGAVSSIHAAVLAAIEADGLDHLLHIVTQGWPETLGLDAVSLAVTVGGRGMRADLSGLQFVEPRMIDRAMQGVNGVVLRGVEQGHPLFGPAASLIRAEALITLSATNPALTGLLVLGQRGGQRFETLHGSELLVFLGATLSRMIGRWLLP